MSWDASGHASPVILSILASGRDLLKTSERLVFDTLCLRARLRGDLCRRFSFALDLRFALCADGGDGLGRRQFFRQHVACGGTSQGQGRCVVEDTFMATKSPIRTAGWRMPAARTLRNMCAQELAYTRSILDPLPGRDADPSAAVAASFHRHHRHAAGRRALLFLYPPRGHSEPAGAAGARRPAWQRPRRWSTRTRCPPMARSLSTGGSLPTMASTWPTAPRPAVRRISTLHVIETASGNLLPDTIGQHAHRPGRLEKR